MKVYLELPVESRGLQRVRDALEEYAPSNIEIVSSPAQCDLAILHIYGRHDSVQRQITYFEGIKKPYAMIQYCLRSTMRPATAAWYKMWQGARLVWSYYDLPQLLEDDGLFKGMQDFRFYHSPLGTNFDVFKETKTERRYVIAASSQGYLSESAKECVVASKAVKRPMFYLGKNLKRGDDVVCKTGITDEELARYYSQSVFVSGMRRVEGFEIPALEGLMCGARPIFFDRPEHRKWFGDLAIFIPEEPREKVIANLEGIFQMSAILPPTVNEQEKAIARKRFDWQTIIEGFWSRVM